MILPGVSRESQENFFCEKFKKDSFSSSISLPLKFHKVTNFSFLQILEKSVFLICCSRSSSFLNLAFHKNSKIQYTVKKFSTIGLLGLDILGIIRPYWWIKCYLSLIMRTCVYLSHLLSVQRPRKLAVAARLRSLRSDDPLSKGHPRSIKQGLEP